MKNVVRDNAAYQNALATRQNANSALSASNQSAQQLRYNEQVTDLQQRQIDAQRGYNAANAVIQAADLVINYGSKIYDVVQQSQSSAVQNEISTSLEEGQRLIQNSIASGKTYFGTNPTTGEMELVMAPEVENWYNSAREKIGSGNYMSQIKENALRSLDLSYESLKTSANGTLVEKYYSDLNTNFATNLELAKNLDVQSYVKAGGDIDTWNTTASIEGVKAINSRSDWSPEARQAQATSYLLDVQQEGDTQIAANLAKTQGLESALTYIESKDYYTTAEKQKMFASASTSATYAKTAASEEAQGIMEDALVNSSATPEQVYAALQERYGSSSPAIQQAVKEAAQLKQTEIVQNMVNNQLSSDITSGASSVYDTYTSIESGAWDDKFYGVESLKSAALSTYSTQITKIEKEVEKTTNVQKKIDDSNKNLFTQYQKLQEINLANFDNGTITGAEYIANEKLYADSFAASLKLGGTTDTTYWTEQSTALSAAAIQKISDMYIPKRYQSAVDDVLENIKIALGNNVTSSNMTPEIAQAIFDNNLEFTGHVADFIKENGATMTDEEFSTWISKEASDYVLLRSGNKTYSLIESGEAFSDTTVMSKVNGEFKNIVKMAYETPGASSWLVKLGTNFETGQANYVFSSDEAEGTWAEMQKTARTQISWLTGLDGDDMTITLDATSGDTVFAPLVTVNDGSFRTFKFDGRGNIYESVEGKKDKDGNTIWRDTGINLANSDKDMAKQKLKAGYSIAEDSTFSSSAGGQKTGLTTSSSKSEQTMGADTWADKNKSASPGAVYQYLKSLDDSELDEAVETFKERVDRDRFLLESFNDPKKALDAYRDKIRGERQ